MKKSNWIIVIISICIICYVVANMIMYDLKELERVSIINEDIVIDITEDINPLNYLENLPDDASVSYEIDLVNKVIKFIVTKNEKEVTLIKDIDIKKPNIEIIEPIVYDLNNEADFNIYNYVRIPEGFNIIYDVDLDGKQIFITISKGLYNETITKDISIIKKIQYIKCDNCQQSKPGPGIIATHVSVLGIKHYYTFCNDCANYIKAHDWYNTWNFEN